ncbi:hypothetical protein SCLCIDRAFT_1225146 [Scleroderma citrinum Foug A]|uniref:Uncharacterized protein n=1 Tax=Scleroderma citrinum Foug A TaxID=1036808 RepID=A0A0C3D2V1_9AGAM|nr:hypothetical protein SCLCIDRAFT_1225146 [Scleroderma citrinum Foug A]
MSLMQQAQRTLHDNWSIALRQRCLLCSRHSTTTDQRPAGLHWLMPMEMSLTMLTRQWVALSVTSQISADRASYRIP